MCTFLLLFLIQYIIQTCVCTSNSGRTLQVENSNIDMLNTDCTYKSSIDDNMIYECIKDNDKTYITPQLINISNTIQYTIYVWTSDFPITNTTKPLAACVLDYNITLESIPINYNVYECNVYVFWNGTTFVPDTDMITIDTTQICISGSDSTLNGQYKFDHYDYTQYSPIFYNAETGNFLFGYITGGGSYQWRIGSNFNSDSALYGCECNNKKFTTMIQDCKTIWFVWNIQSNSWQFDDNIYKTSNYCYLSSKIYEPTLPNLFTLTPTLTPTTPQPTPKPNSQPINILSTINILDFTPAPVNKAHFTKGLYVRLSTCETPSMICEGGNCYSEGGCPDKWEKKCNSEDLYYTYNVSEIDALNVNNFGAHNTITVENGCMYENNYLMENYEIYMYSDTSSGCTYDNGEIWDCKIYVCTTTQPYHCTHTTTKSADNGNNNGQNGNNNGQNGNGGNGGGNLDSDSVMSPGSIVLVSVGGVALIVIGFVIWKFLIAPKMQTHTTNGYQNMNKVEMDAKLSINN